MRLPLPIRPAIISDSVPAARIPMDLLRRPAAIALLAALLAACAGRPRLAQEPDFATAELTGVGGHTFRGTLRFEQIGVSSVRIRGELQGLEPGKSYALHIHTERNCHPRKEPGEDFDPFDSGRHGPPHTDPGTRHAGDLPPVTANVAGVGNVSIPLAQGLSLWHDIYSIMGRAVVLHAGPDDSLTSPHGGAGGRAACGLITAQGTSQTPPDTLQNLR